MGGAIRQSRVFHRFFFYSIIIVVSNSSSSGRLSITALSVEGFGLLVAGLAGVDVRGSEPLGLGLLKIAFSTSIYIF